MFQNGQNRFVLLHSQSPQTNSILLSIMQQIEK